MFVHVGLFPNDPHPQSPFARSIFCILHCFRLCLSVCIYLGLYFNLSGYCSSSPSFSLSVMSPRLATQRVRSFISLYSCTRSQHLLKRTLSTSLHPGGCCRRAANRELAPSVRLQREVRVSFLPTLLAPTKLPRVAIVSHHSSSLCCERPIHRSWCEKRCHCG